MENRVQAIIKQRRSCRTYEDKPIAPETVQQLKAHLATAGQGPLGTTVRLELLVAAEHDRAALRGLVSYGFVKNPAAFIVGAVAHGAKDMEDFGYLMERAILEATALGLGTCWLGGTFSRSRFAELIGLQAGESLPAVASVGYAAGRPRLQDVLVRRMAGADRRLPWSTLFFDGEWGVPMTPQSAGVYAKPLEMVRLGPSASNRQPWRILRQGRQWHFYLRRTPGYRQVGAADLQRVDMGIAMCHWALTTGELGPPGGWQVADPGLALPDALSEYVVSWIEG